MVEKSVVNVRLGLLIAIFLCSIYSVVAMTMPVTTDTSTNISCNFPATHYLDLADGKMNVACTVSPTNTTVSCTTIVYVQNSSTEYTDVLQTNPTYSFLTDQNPTFDNQNGVINTYFNKKNLLAGNTRQYAVLCTTPTGVVITTSDVTANITTSAIYNLPAYFVFFKSTMAYWIMGIIGGIIIILLLMVIGVIRK